MHLRSRSTGSLVNLATVIVPMAVLGAVLVGPAVAAPPSPPPNLDHFRCYSNTGHPALPPIATLEDQFDERLEKVEEVVVVWPIGFCNPVAKTIPSPGGGPGQTTEIQHATHHLTMYEIRETTRQRHPTWKVTVDNQFGRQTLFATKPVLLGVPTHKVSVGVDPVVPTGLDPPEGLNHFKCYQAKGAPLNAAVTLEDQFETTDLLVVAPVLFCNPVEKTVTSTTGVSIVTPIVDPEAHLTCYNLKLATQIGFSTNISIQTNNQFSHISPEPFTVVTDERVLCVPSNKAAFLGMPGSFTTP